MGEDERKGRGTVELRNGEKEAGGRRLKEKATDPGGVRGLFCELSGRVADSVLLDEVSGHGLVDGEGARGVEAGDLAQEHAAGAVAQHRDLGFR